MTIGACDVLPAPPFDYEKEPLVTSTVKLNTDNLRKAVRWLVDCVQDQQQALARHGRRLDESDSPKNRAAAADRQSEASPSAKSIHGADSEGSPTMKRASLSDGFSSILQGELLDMKINAVKRSLTVELPRMSDLDSERARMQADSASLQQDLTTRFQEAQKEIHAELADTTSKLFEQLSRISSDVVARIEELEQKVNSNTAARTIEEPQQHPSPHPPDASASASASATASAPTPIKGISSDVISRIEVLEQKVNSNTADMAAMRSSPTPIERTEKPASATEKPASATVEAKSPPSESAKRPSSQGIEKAPSPGAAEGPPSSAAEGPPSSAAEGPPTEPLNSAPEAQPASSSSQMPDAETAPLPGDAALQPDAETAPLPGDAASQPDAETAAVPGDAASRPATSGTVGAGSIQAEGSSTSTNDESMSDSRKPVLKASTGADAEDPCVAAGGLGSLAEIEDKLAAMAQAQREALEQVQGELVNMGATLQAESEQRLGLQKAVQKEFRGLKQAQESANEDLNELLTVVDDLQEKMDKMQEGASGDYVRPDRSSRLASQQDEPVVGSSGTSEQAAEVEVGADGRQQSLDLGSEGQEVTAQSQEAMPQEVNEQAVNEQPVREKRTRKAAAPGGPSLHSLVHGAVKKVTEGAQSAGVQDEGTDRHKQAFREEAVGWLNQDGPGSRASTPEVMDSIGMRGAIPKTQRGAAIKGVLGSGAGSDVTPDAEAMATATQALPTPPQGTTTTPPQAQVTAVSNVTSESVTRLDDRISDIEQALPDMEKFLLGKFKKLSDVCARKFKVIEAKATANTDKVKNSRNPDEVEGSVNPDEVEASVNPDEVKGSVNPDEGESFGNPDEVKGSVKVLEGRMFELEERMQVMEIQPAPALKMTELSSQVPEYGAPSGDVKPSVNEPLAPRRKSDVGTSPRSSELVALLEHHELLRQRVESLEEALVKQPSPADAASQAPGAEDFQRIEENLREMVRASQESTQNDFTNLGGEIQELKRGLEQFGGRTVEMLSRLSNIEGIAGAAGDGGHPSASSSSDMPQTAAAKSQDLNLSQVLSTSAGSASEVTPSGSRMTFPPLTGLLDAALDKGPSDYSHLMDPMAHSETPLAYVSKQGLQEAVDGLTDNFRSWLDAIHQSIITAMQSKADSAQVEAIAKQVRDAAGRASDSIASFTRRAIGGNCASCNAPISYEAMFSNRRIQGSSQGRWMPHKSGAQHAIRPPTTAPPVPVCGASRLPNIRDFRQHQHALTDSSLGIKPNHKSFPKGKVFTSPTLKNVASAPEMKILGLS